MHPAIRVDNLSKLYQLGESQQGYKTLRESLTDAIAAPFRKLRAFSSPQSPVPSPRSSDFWALKDVSFEIQPGEVVGIIGRNGAGKSTLLKVLSRITEPTSGRIELRGRVGSLLEVGTGFHPELNGRENIYMNGSILGMSRREIAKKFDEIVAFAEIENFLETPVKRYSSGMYVRLAFAVAANLEPEILIVDEVLAVGDLEFQKRCLGKMESVANGGRTVLFVSHNLSTLEALCKHGLILSQGGLIHSGNISGCITEYMKSLANSSRVDLSSRTDRRGIGEIRLQNIVASIGNGHATNCLMTGKTAQFIFELNEIRPDMGLMFTIHDQRGAPICNLDTWRRSAEDSFADTEDRTIVCQIPELPLRSGRYYINAQVGYKRDIQDYVEGALYFDVENGVFQGRGMPYANSPGIVCMAHSWRLQRCQV